VSKNFGELSLELFAVLETISDPDKAHARADAREPELHVDPAKKIVWGYIDAIVECIHTVRDHAHEIDPEHNKKLEEALNDGCDGLVDFRDYYAAEYDNGNVYPHAGLDVDDIHM